MNLLCRIGLHHAAYTPAVRHSQDRWLKIRTCTRCGKPLPRNHR